MIFEIAVPTKDKRMTKAIIISAKGKFAETTHRTLKISGNKKIIMEALKKADIYNEVIREESLDGKVKKVKRMVALISKNKKAQTEWDEWSSKYEFNYSKADTYDISNAKTSASKIIKKFDLKEAKLKEASALDKVLSTPDPYDRYSMIYNWISGDPQITLEDFAEIMGAIKSGESALDDSSKVNKLAVPGTAEGQKARSLIMDEIGRNPGYFFFSGDEDIDYFNDSIADPKDTFFWDMLIGAEDLDIVDIESLFDFIARKENSGEGYAEDKMGATPESEQARSLIKDAIGDQPGYMFFSEESDIEAFDMEFQDDDSDAFWFTLTNDPQLDISSVEDLGSYIEEIA